MVETDKSESPELNTDFDSKLKRLLWSKNETQIMGKFLMGEEIATVAGPERKDNWLEVVASTAIEQNETERLVAIIHEHLQSNSPPSGEIREKKEIDSNKITNEEEYRYTTKKSTETAVQIVGDMLRKVGIWDTEDSRSIRGYGGFRKKDKSNYSQTEKIGEEVEERGYITPEMGGISLVEEIFAPQLENSKNTSGHRTRRSLSHETQHFLRQLSNKSLWKGHKQEADEAKLRKPDSPDKEKYIGGYYVGSNMQGSESVGELFALSVGYKLDFKKEPTIKDLIKPLHERVSSKLESVEKKLKESKEPQLRYLTANFALLQHLESFVENGYGEIRATDLMTLGSYGYVSFEKIPELIQLGVIDQKKFQNMRQVVGNIYEWLTSADESGFKINIK